MIDDFADFADFVNSINAIVVPFCVSQLLLSRLLGAVPGPPVFGGLLDSACLLSQGDASGGGTFL